MSFVKDAIFGNDDAEKAAKKAARTQARAQRESLDYLKEINELPQMFKEEALKGLGGLYGLEGGTGSQQELIQRAMDSPLYQQLMGGQEAGEEAILRNAAATGGLRSGNVQQNLYDYNTQLQNQALTQSYNQQLQGLGGLAGVSTNENNIANMMSGIGRTQAQGIMGGAQSQQAANQAGMSGLLGLGSLGASLYSSGAGSALLSGLGSLGAMFSDRRLKKNLKKVFSLDGINWYRWDWNKLGNALGLEGSSQGVIADEIYDDHPGAVSLRNDFMMVDYGKLFA